MAHPSQQLVLKAVESLKGRPPLAVVSIPALLRAAVEEKADPVIDGVTFGSAHERQLLADFFRLPRSPYSDRPYRAVWDENETGPNLWRDGNYGGRSLQRRRTDFANRGQIFKQVKLSRRVDRWYLLPNAGEDLVAEWSAKGSGEKARVRLIDLALWFGREGEFGDIEDVQRWFTESFQPDRGDLVGTIFLDDIPDEYRAYAFVEEGLVDTDFAEQMGSLPPALTLGTTFDTLISDLEHELAAKRFILPVGLVRRVLTAWMRGDLVVLSGQPGTGKTRFATLLAAALESKLGLAKPLLIPVREDFDEAEFLGYERLDGQPQLREFSTRVLQATKPLEPQVVILEEFNLATIESYLSSVLVASQESSRSVLLPGGTMVSLPVDTFVIATCNSYRDEPETRTRISAPAKRRSTVITMSNVLADRVLEAGGPDAAGFGALIAELAVDRIKDEEAKVKARSDADQATTFDGTRLELLSGVRSPESLSEAVRARLAAVSRAILATPEGRSWFTFGLLRDVALAIAYAGRDESAELSALAHAVCDKLVHQLRGQPKNGDDLVAALAGGPGAAEVEDLVRRMQSGGASDELVPLL